MFRLSRDSSGIQLYNLVEAQCYSIGRTGQIVEQSHSSEKTDRNVDVSTAKVFVSYNAYTVRTYFDYN